jgi:Protein of unknown function (DUF2934)
MRGLDEDQAIRERAYFLWENEGRPEGRALDHWQRAAAEERLVDEEKVLAGRSDANIPAMLTKDVPGG